MSSIEKTLARVFSRIQNEEYYEAHQAVRTVVARYARTKDHASAIGLLYTSAVLLAKVRQTGSASDLLIYMLNEYNAAQIPVDASSRGRVAQVVWQLDPRDAVLKQVAKSATTWASKNGGPVTGDPELNHVFGVQFGRAAQPYEAEKYLLLGTRFSAEALADLHRQWYLLDAHEPHRELYISRGVLGYLSVQDIRGARAYLERTLAILNKPVQGQDVDGVIVYEDMPWLNFFQLLVRACQTKQALLYHKLVDHYKPKEFASWAQVLTVIEEVYFGIIPRRQMNLADLMGGIFA